MGSAALASSSTDHVKFLGTRTFGSLDGLRAISILAVLWHHTLRGPPSLPISDRGFLGVDLFFVISGFLIVTLLLRERRRTGEISLRSFYVRRFLRIFPPYYLMLLLVACASFLKGGRSSAGVFHDLPYALLYVSNMVPMSSVLSITWSLATEEQFYIVIPTLQKYASRFMRVMLPVLYVMACLPTFGFFPSLDLPGFFRQTTFGPILLGVMLAHVLNDPRGFGWLFRALRHRGSTAVALALVLLAANHPAADISGWPRIFIHWSMAVLVAACVVREEHVLVPALTAWPMRRIGTVSYGIYLYHMLTWYFVDKGMAAAGARSELLFFLGNSLAAWGVAEISFRWFESPVLALKSRFEAGPKAPVPHVGATGA